MLAEASAYCLQDLLFSATYEYTTAPPRRPHVRPATTFSPYSSAHRLSRRLPRPRGLRVLDKVVLYGDMRYAHTSPRPVNGRYAASWGKNRSNCSYVAALFIFLQVSSISSLNDEGMYENKARWPPRPSYDSDPGTRTPPNPWSLAIEIQSQVACKMSPNFKCA